MKLDGIIGVNFSQVARWPRPRVDRQGQPICIKLRTSPSNAVGAGEVWSGEGTLVVAHLALPKEEPRHPLWSPALPWFAPCRITPSLLPSAGDHQGPHPPPPPSRPYGYRRHLS